MQSALDEKDDEIRRLEIQQGKSEAQVEMLLNSLSDSKLVAQRAEAEMKLLRIGGGGGNHHGNHHHGEGSTSSQQHNEDMDDAGIESGGVFGLTAVGDENNDNSGESGGSGGSGGSGTEEEWRLQLDTLREEYSLNLKKNQDKHDKKFKTEKEKRLNIEGEWNQMEYDLRGEREEHLRTCIQLKGKNSHEYSCTTLVVGGP